LVGGSDNKAAEVSESNFAEIIWFVRGTTLYRQTKLIIGEDANQIEKFKYEAKNADGTPILDADGKPVMVFPANIENFHDKNDVSVFQKFNDPSDPSKGVAISFNKLSDLSRREYRFAHFYVGMPNFPFPHNPIYRELRLPTMAELNGGFRVTGPITHPTEVDLWNEPNYAANAVDTDLYPIDANGTGWLSNGERRGEDIVLTNVISFDIKVWNPTVNRFVDLGDGSDGAFGSQGRYSGRPVTGNYENLVQKVYFDENFDRKNKRIPDNSNPDDPDATIENPRYHDISPDYPQKYLYQENDDGLKLPLSNIETVTPPSQIPPLPSSTLEIGAWGYDPVLATWKYDRMSRVFDTWTKWYESQLRNSENVPDLGDLTNPTSPPTATTVSKIEGNNSHVTRTEFFLVTFRQQTDSEFPMGRWRYLHSPNPDPVPPDFFAARFFETYMYIVNPTAPAPDQIQKQHIGYQHPGTGIILHDKKSGAYWESPPPYDELLRGVEITIRCFDPKSGNIRQVRIVKHVDL
jgi:hypothetical protein